MGKAKKRVNPKVTSRTNRNFKKRYTEELLRAIDKLPPPWTVINTGRPPHEPKVVAVLCAYIVTFQLTYNGIESELLLIGDTIMEHFGINKLPGHSVIHRGMMRLPMKYIRRLNKRVVKRFRRKKMMVILDATGFRVKTSSGWYDIRMKRINNRKDYDKLHIVIDARRGAILEFQITGSKTHDSTKLKALLRDTNEMLRVPGDAGYLLRKNCTIVMSKGGKPFFALKKNTTVKESNPDVWKEMVSFARENTGEWEKLYHLRSYVEAIFSAIKRRFGEKLTAIKKRIHRKQLALKVLARIQYQAGTVRQDGSHFGRALLGCVLSEKRSAKGRLVRLG
jgi:hypothetical protein